MICLRLLPAECQAQQRWCHRRPHLVLHGPQQGVEASCSCVGHIQGALVWPALVHCRPAIHVWVPVNPLESHAPSHWHLQRPVKPTWLDSS